MPASSFRPGVFASLLLLAAGCGQSETPSTATTGTDSPSASAATATPETASAGPATVNASTVSMATATPSAAAGAEVAAEPEPGTPEWSIREIMRIRLLPLPSLETAQAEPPAGDDGSIVEAAATTADPEKIQQVVAQTRELRRSRNLEIVKLSMDAMAKSAKTPEKEDVFNAAVQQFLDAHLQLALQGDEESIAALYEAADAFYARQADSSAAAQAQFILVNLAHANALRYAKAEPRWLQEFSRHAQLLATRFPDESSQTLPLLLAAGRSCELNGLTDDAKACFSLIQTKFPESPQATQVAGISRRLNLVGQKIEFGGPTFDGNHVTLEDYQGKTIVVIFWATHAKPFLDNAAALQALSDKYKKYAQVLSVNLDSEDIAIDNFIEKNNLTWPIIFHVDHDKRGWNAPLAAYYGVTSVPTIWIIDPTGTVAATDLTPENLEASLRDVILKHRAAAAANAGENRTGT